MVDAAANLGHGMMQAAQLSALFDAHGARLVLYARQWLDGSAAQDVVQEVFVRLLVEPASPANAKAWLFKAVRNEAISQTRSGIRRHRREQACGREEWFDPLPGDLIDADAAREAVQTLPGRSARRSCCGFGGN